MLFFVRHGGADAHPRYTRLSQREQDAPAARHRGQPNHRAANHDFTMNPPCADRAFTTRTLGSHREFVVLLWSFHGAAVVF